VLLWSGEGNLEPRARRTLESADAIVVSAASIWEIEIKRARGRLTAPLDVAARAIEEGFDSLSITLDHAREAGRLPLHHRDPFDRMLVAQARLEGLTLATADATLAEYDVPVLSVSRG
jgi:PIN domain nuclease of toxin-antitoxin system